MSCPLPGPRWREGQVGERRLRAYGQLTKRSRLGRTSPDATTPGLGEADSVRLQRRVIRGCKSPPGPSPRVCNQRKLRRREAGWRATGGESPVGNVSEFDSICGSGQPSESGEARNRKEALRAKGA